MAKLRTHLAALARRMAAMEARLHGDADAVAEAVAAFELAREGVAAGIYDPDLLTILRAVLPLPRDPDPAEPAENTPIN